MLNTKSEKKKKIKSEDTGFQLWHFGDGAWRMPKQH